MSLIIESVKLNPAFQCEKTYYIDINGVKYTYELGFEAAEIQKNISHDSNVCIFYSETYRIINHDTKNCVIAMYVNCQPEKISPTIRGLNIYSYNPNYQFPIIPPTVSSIFISTMKDHGIRRIIKDIPNNVEVVFANSLTAQQISIA